MVAATAFLAINLWTGAPLIALWVGSQVVGTSVLSMKAVIVVVVVLAVLVFSMSMALTWLSAEYDRLSGREPGERRLPWARGMSRGWDRAAELRPRHHAARARRDGQRLPRRDLLAAVVLPARRRARRPML